MKNVQSQQNKLFSKFGKTFVQKFTEDGHFKYWQLVEKPQQTEHLTEDGRFTFVTLSQ